MLLIGFGVTLANVGLIARPSSENFSSEARPMKAWLMPPIGVPLLILIVVVMVHLFGRAT